MSDLLLKSPVIPVIVIENADDAEPLAEALLRGGMQIIEITCRTPAAIESLKRIKKAFPEMLTGAGTVVTREQADACLEAGVDFGLAPGLNPETVQLFTGAQKPFIPGIMTPSEVEQALGLGCKLLKFFPAEASGGLKLLKNLYAPYAFSGIRFCPTGGINLQNMSTYLSEAMIFAVGGSWLATLKQIREHRWEEITAQVKEALAVAGQVRGASS